MVDWAEERRCLPHLLSATHSGEHRPARADGTENGSQILSCRGLEAYFSANKTFPEEVRSSLALG